MERTVKDVVPALQTNRDGVSHPRVLSAVSYRTFPSSDSQGHC